METSRDFSSSKDAREMHLEKRGGLRENVPVINAFREAGWPLSRTLEEMLHESTDHRYVSEKVPDNLRKGSGFLQATREMSRSINAAQRTTGLRRVRDSYINVILPRLFEALPERREELEELQRSADALSHNEALSRKAIMAEKEQRVAAREKGETDLSSSEDAINSAFIQQNDDEYDLRQIEDRIREIVEEALPGGRTPKEWWIPDPEKIEAIKVELRKAPIGDQLIGRMTLDLITPVEETTSPVLLLAKTELQVGTCTTAEVYFLDAVTRARGYQLADVIVDHNDKPIMLFKNAGERSAITLTETVLNGVRLPPGSLVAIDLGDADPKGRIPLDGLSGFKFLRLTTLAVPPEQREESVGNVYALQRSQNMRGFDTVTIDDLVHAAQRLLARY